MKKSMIKQFEGLFWLWKNRKTMFPILKYEIGTRYYSSKYDLNKLGQRMKTLAIQDIGLPELLKKEKNSGGGRARVL